jgi:hypothetical protein
MIEASCHCGAVSLKVSHAPQDLTDCNCSICRRYGALWAYYSPNEVEVSGQTDIYMWGLSTIEFHRCKHCGCLTHWFPAERYRSMNRMAINARLAAAPIVAAARIHHFDGAESWKTLD